MTKRRVGFILPFTKKWGVNRKLKGLEKEAEKLGHDFCDLSKRFDKAKEEAAGVFTKKDYDERTRDIEVAMRKGTKCFEIAARPPSRSPGGEIEETCRASVLKKYGRKGWQKWDREDPERKKAESEVDDCMKRGGPDDAK